MKEQNYGDSQYKFRGRGAGGRKGRTWGAEKILRAVKLQLLTPTDPARPTWSADGTLCLAGNNVSIRVLFTTSGRCSWQGQCVWGGGRGVNWELPVPSASSSINLKLLEKKRSVLFLLKQ